MSDFSSKTYKKHFKNNPIFIGGDGRSGTTLLSVILDSHPDLAIGPELHFNGDKLVNLGPYIIKCIKLMTAGPPGLLRKLLPGKQIYGKMVKEDPHYKPGVQFVLRCERAGIPAEVLRKLIKEQMSGTNRDMHSFEERCGLINALGEYNCSKYGKSRWGFKIMREIKNVQKYVDVWPNAQFIHIIRDGRDVAASQMLEHGSWGYDMIENAASGWVNIIAQTRKNSENCSLLEVRYEDLVNDSVTAINRILNFLKEPWHDDVLNHDKKEHALFESKVRHPSRSAVSRPINKAAIGRYRKDLSAEQIGIFNQIAGKMLMDLGYTVEA